MKKLLFILIISFSSCVTFSVNVEGYITELYANDTGKVAFKIKGGFSDEAIALCPGSNGYAGNIDADDFLKSVLLAGKLSRMKMRFTLTGCDANGSWIKVASVYVL